ncbi:hypothetical protein STRAU_4598 [Streptomyces aurantiacus JA 4570]|uniref:Uncharacterized protein n=1 Tax=Streptomyces aurantiacus JA 4570 TaxID=1286094 RepID=S3ZV91_9ACTN|nr:hypothetical protein STRAU_4598 [Streptomyces aurantiacus JA 4570]
MIDHRRRRRVPHGRFGIEVHPSTDSRYTDSFGCGGLTQGGAAVWCG